MTRTGQAGVPGSIAIPLALWTTFKVSALNETVTSVKCAQRSSRRVAQKGAVSSFLWRASPSGLNISIRTPFFDSKSGCHRSLRCCRRIRTRFRGRVHQHGQMAVCTSSLCPSSISPVIDSTCAGTALRQKNRLKDNGIRKRWKQSRTSVVAIAMENSFNNLAPASVFTFKPAGKTISIRPNPSEDSSRTPRGSRKWAFDRLAPNIRRSPPLDIRTKSTPTCSG